MLTTITINFVPFVLFTARWLVCFDKNGYFCLGTGQIYRREIIQACGWGAGSNGRDLVRIS